MKHGKKLLSLCIAAVMFGTAAMPANASENGTTIAISQYEFTTDELAEQGYTIPVYVELTENIGIDVFEYGLSVDSRCTYEVITADALIRQNGGSPLGFMTANETLDITWVTGISTTLCEDTGTLAVLLVTLPEDAAAGDVFEINYLDYYSQSHMWVDYTNNIDYAKLGEVDWTDGYIAIVSDEVQQYLIHFDANGGTTDTSAKIVTYGEPIGTLPTAEREGYTFDGWVTNSGNPINEEMLYVSPFDTTLYAKWICNAAAGDVDLNGDVNIMDAITLSQALMKTGDVLTLEQAQQADCNGDTLINSTDTLRILQYLVGLVDTLPSP